MYPGQRRLQKSVWNFGIETNSDASFCGKGEHKDGISHRFSSQQANFFFFDYRRSLMRPDTSRKNQSQILTSEALSDNCGVT